MIYFTSDTHFGHAFMAEIRGLASVERMDALLMFNWNRLIGPKDTVYHLGDFAFANKARVVDLLSKLNGKKILVRGNHDGKSVTKADGWESVYDSYLEVRWNPDAPKAVLCHYALRVWNKCHHGAYHLFGHSHGNMPGNDQSTDVGVDCWNLSPITMEQAICRMRDSAAYQAEDHHQPRSDT